MAETQLSDILFAKLAGWEVVKQARALVAAGRVLSSEWQPPNLHGAVQEGSTTYRAGLVIRGASDADNLCPCRDSRQRGLICAHSVAVGLHFIKSRTVAIPSVEKKAADRPAAKKTVKAIPRTGAEEKGEALEI